MAGDGHSRLSTTLDRGVQERRFLPRRWPSCAARNGQTKQYDSVLPPPRQVREAQASSSTNLRMLDMNASLAIASQNITLPFLPIIDRPSIDVEPTQTVLDARREALESHALHLRTFMYNPQRDLPEDCQWSATPDTNQPPTEFLALPKGSLPLLQEEVKPVGLPIPPSHREHLCLLAYATSCKPQLTFAGTILIEKADFECICFNTELTEVES